MKKELTFNARFRKEDLTAAAQGRLLAGRLFLEFLGRSSRLCNAESLEDPETVYRYGSLTNKAAFDKYVYRYDEICVVEIPENWAASILKTQREGGKIFFQLVRKVCGKISARMISQKAKSKN